MPVTVTKVNGTQMVRFGDIPTPGWFEHGGKLHARIPDACQEGSSTIRNAIRFPDVTVESFKPDDMVYAATAQMNVEYSTV